MVCTKTNTADLKNHRDEIRKMIVQPENAARIVDVATMTQAGAATVPLTKRAARTNRRDVNSGAVHIRVHV